MSNQYGNHSKCSLKDYPNAKWFKVIATTDRSLGLLNIPKFYVQHFVEQWFAGNKIKKVELQYEYKCLFCDFKTENVGNVACVNDKVCCPKCGGNLAYPLSLKGNEVIPLFKLEDPIWESSKEKVKDKIYTEEEILKILHRYENDMLYFGRDSYYKNAFPEATEKWFKENIKPKGTDNKRLNILAEAGFIYGSCKNPEAFIKAIQNSSYDLNTLRIEIAESAEKILELIDYHPEDNIS